MCSETYLSQNTMTNKINKILQPKLMQILSRDDICDVVTWMPHGQSFIFIDPERFTNEILPNYFRKSKFSSFIRKLYRWGFRQIRKVRNIALDEYIYIRNVLTVIDELNV